MSVTPVTDFTFSQNDGFVLTDTSPIIHSIRWRHLTSGYTFINVEDVTVYHETNDLTIDINTTPLSLIDVYFRKSAGITSAELYLRFVRESTGTLVEEPVTIGEGGKTISLLDATDPDLQEMTGVAFTNQDQGDGTPIYDFLSMAGSGMYELWVKATNSTGTLHLRVPFQFAGLTSTTTTTEPIDHDGYIVSVVEGSSPFTKRPTVGFRPAGVGLLKQAFCFSRVLTPPTLSVSNPSPGPISGIPVTPPLCEFEVSPASINGLVGDIVSFVPTHKNTSGVQIIDAIYDTTKLDQISDFEFELLVSGNPTIIFEVVYNDGQMCDYEVTLSVSELQLSFSCDLSLDVSTVAPASSSSPESLCQFSITGDDTVHGEVTIFFSHANTSGVSSLTSSYDTSLLSLASGTNDKHVYKTLADNGNVDLILEVVYNDGQVCQKAANYTWSQSTTSDPMEVEKITLTSEVNHDTSSEIVYGGLSDNNLPQNKTAVLNYSTSSVHDGYTYTLLASGYDPITKENRHSIISRINEPVVGTSDAGQVVVDGSLFEVGDEIRVSVQAERDGDTVPDYVRFSISEPI